METKICNKCKKELPINRFYEYNGKIICRCKDCLSMYGKMYKKSKNGKNSTKRANDKRVNTFCRIGRYRGNSGMLKRDYELTDEQKIKRNRARGYRKYNSPIVNPHGVLIWYSKKLDEISIHEYKKELTKEYWRQKMCAIRGYVGRAEPSVNFLFDFDLEQMLKDKVHYKSGKRIKFIEKWWEGEIRHWTVKDGIWKK